MSINNNGSASVANANASFINYNYSALVYAVKLVQVTRFSYTVYAQLGSYQSMSIFATCTLGGKWTTNISVSTDPGANRATVQSGTHLASFINGNVGIGTTNPTGELTFVNNVVNRKIVLYNVGGADEFFGFGINNSSLRLNVGSTTSTFNFYGVTTQYGYVNNATGFINTFTGQHRSFPDTSLIPFIKYTSKIVGLIVCASGAHVSLNQDTPKFGREGIQVSEAIPTVRLANTSNDPTVFGVVSDIEDPEKRKDHYGSFVTTQKKILGDTRIFINSIGEGAVWVCDANGPFYNGDYITSSVIPGYGAKQHDSLMHNYTVAKITMDCDFNAASVPKMRIKKRTDAALDSETFYDLDAYGNIQWEQGEDSSGNPVFEPPYDMRYLLKDGTVIDKDEYDRLQRNGDSVYRAAFVGCTYHCG